MHGLDAVIERVEVLVAEGDDGEAAALADDLVRRVTAISDRALLPTTLRTFTGEVDDAGLLACLHTLLRRSRGGHRGARQVAQELALNHQLFEQLPYDRLRDLYEAAHHADMRDLALMFFSNRGRQTRTVEESGEENEHLSLPLGVRKQAARGRDRDLLDRLMRDTNPQVIRILLNNPWLRERDVLFIAAKRPTTPEVLTVVARHRRWASRYRIRKALACNPYTPSQLAQQLLGTLLSQDLRFIAATGVLSDEVRAQAEHLLRTR
ncbi:MAG: hypothetical protein H6739_07345 [Alphaproteobacteria bacterium]|nr:hypothetical protein [Alphaproteobacteria bacterium]